MNTTPDNESLALWLEDELDGEARVRIDAWASEHPEYLEERERNRAWRSTMQSVIPAEVEMPSAEFFNARIMREIATPAATHPANVVSMAPAAGKRRVWLMPAAAAAGMVLAFLAGSRIAPKSVQTTITEVRGNEPVIYTPEAGVKAASFADAKGTLIVLDGVQAISDTRELMEASVNPQERKEIDNTADTQQPDIR